MDLKQFDKMLHDTEVKLKRLKSLYEQWFQGIERIEPSVPRKDVERSFKILQKEKPRNTAARFKLNTLQSRFNTYSTHWSRIARRIEEGTYERDLKRVRKRRQVRERAEAQPVQSYEIDLDMDFDPDSLFAEDEISGVLAALEQDRPQKQPRPQTPSSGMLSTFAGLSSGNAFGSVSDLPGEDTSPNAVNPFSPPSATFGKPKADPAPARPVAVAKPARPRPPPPPRRPPPPPPRGAKPPPPPRPGAKPQPPGAKSPEPMRRLYAEFTAARREHNHKGDLGYDKLARKVDSLRAKLSKKHAGKKIDFEVVVKNGKVGLKPKIG